MFAEEMGISEEEFLKMSPKELYEKIDVKVKTKNLKKSKQLEIEEIKMLLNAMKNEKKSTVTNISILSNNISNILNIRIVLRFFDKLKSLFGLGKNN